MKKFLAILVVISCLVVLASCGTTTTTNTPDVVDDPAKKSEGVMTYAEFMAAEVDAPVVIEAYVQAHQAWWDEKVVVYAQDADGGYFIYNMTCSEADAAKLVPGTKIKVTGYKTEFMGEVEIDVGATFEFEEGSYIAPAVDVTADLGTENLIKSMNKKVTFKGLTIEACEDANGNQAAFLYKYNGTGVEGDDLYFKASKDGNTYTFMIESYLCDASSEVYTTVKSLKVGDTVDMEGFLYWYNGSSPHITSVVVK